MLPNEKEQGLIDLKVFAQKQDLDQQDSQSAAQRASRPAAGAMEKSIVARKQHSIWYFEMWLQLSCALWL